MHSESQLRKLAKILLEKYGELKTSEVKDRLLETIKLDEEDSEPSPSRTGEIKIQQNIGNIVSHQNETIKCYKEGFLIDKTEFDATWKNTYGINNNKIDQKQNNNKLKSKTNPRKVYKKINWDEINERLTAKGRAGEEYVFNCEVERVGGINKKLIDRVQHLSAYQGDGFGYDILSVDEKGKSIFIEVKTTENKNPDTPFYMSVNERDFFAENKKYAYIYRVYDFDLEHGVGKVIIISSKELFDNYCFDPISFRVMKKK